MFKSIPFFGNAGVLATVVLLLAAGPSQAQRGRAVFHGMAMSRPGITQFHGTMAMAHPGMSGFHRSAAGLQHSAGGLRHGTGHFASNAVRVTTPRMSNPRMNSPQVITPNMITPQMAAVAP